MLQTKHVTHIAIMLYNLTAVSIICCSMYIQVCYINQA